MPLQIMDIILSTTIIIDEKLNNFLAVKLGDFDFDSRLERFIAEKRI